jgi:hypothetical protein
LLTVKIVFDFLDNNARKKYINGFSTYLLLRKAMNVINAKATTKHKLGLLMIVVNLLRIIYPIV